jgi:hypothetical protein
MDRFQNNYVTFYESVSSIVSPEFWESNKPTLPESSDEQIELFVVNWYPHMKEVSNGNLTYFKDNKISPLIFQNLKFLDLIDQLNLKNKNVVWEYLHSLYALSISNKHTQDKFNIETKDGTQENKELLLSSIQQAIKDFPEFISNMVSWRKEIQHSCNNQKTGGEASNEETKTPKLDDNFLENSALAKLAKQISDEINPSELLNIGDDLKNMDNPMKMFQSLLSGDKENGVGKLMTTVCDKLKQKMESGEVNQEELLKEATNLLQTMGGLGAATDGKSKSGSPDLAGMMSMMQNLSSLGDIFNGPTAGKSHGKGRKFKRRMGKKINKMKKNEKSQKNL